MNERIFFKVETKNGTVDKMELLAKIKDDITTKNYIIYKNCDDNDIHYYAASCDENEENEFTNLDTNLSEEEKEKLNKVFINIMSGDDNNA